MYCLSFQGKLVSLRTAVDCEAKKHLENVIKNILGLFSSADASFISANVEKFIQYHLFAEDIKRKRRKERTKQSIYTTKPAVILNNTGQIIKNNKKHKMCVNKRCELRD